MKRNSLTVGLVLAALTMVGPVNARHSDGDPDACFPACEVAVPQANSVRADPEETAVSERAGPMPDACQSQPGWMGAAEGLNAQLKPVRDVVGYVRSPQGLAVKLFNDHVFRIPEWINFAIDPVGTLRHKAVAEVRNRAKQALSSRNPGCDSAEQMLERISIDAA